MSGQAKTAGSPAVFFCVFCLHPGSGLPPALDFFSVVREDFPMTKQENTPGVCRSPSAAEAGFSFLPVVSGLFTGVLVLSNILAAKMLQIGPFVFDGGTILFPLSYIFGDVLTEVYGYREARKVIWTGFFTLILMSLAIAVVGVLPAQAEWTFQTDFDHVLRQVPRIALASILGYFSGEYVNSVTLSKIKVATGGKFFWLRAVVSTLAGQFFDTAIFVTAAFAGAYSASVLLVMGLSNYLLKTAVEVLFLPLTYAVVRCIKKLEKADVYDYRVSYSPFLHS